MSGRGAVGVVNVPLVACYPLLLVASLMSLAIEALAAKLLAHEDKVVGGWGLGVAA